MTSLKNTSVRTTLQFFNKNYTSLSTVVLNNKDWPGKLWLPKMCPKTDLQEEHRSIATALTMLKIYSNI